MPPGTFSGGLDPAAAAKKEPDRRITDGPALP